MHKRTFQVLFSLAIVFALASIAFTLGSTITGSVTKDFNLGTSFSYMTMATLGIILLMFIIEYLAWKKS